MKSSASEKNTLSVQGEELGDHRERKRIREDHKERKKMLGDHKGTKWDT